MSLGTKIHENIRRILRRHSRQEENAKSLPDCVKDVIRLGSLDDEGLKSIMKADQETGSDDRQHSQLRKTQSCQETNTPLKVVMNDLDDVVADMLSSLHSCPRTKPGSSDSGSGSSRSGSRRSSRTSMPSNDDSDTDEEDTDACQGSLGIPGLHRSLSVALFPTDGYVV